MIALRTPGCPGERGLGVFLFFAEEDVVLPDRTWMWEKWSGPVPNLTGACN